MIFGSVFGHFTKERENMYTINVKNIKINYLRSAFINTREFYLKVDGKCDQNQFIEQIIREFVQ